MTKLQMLVRRQERRTIPWNARQIADLLLAFLKQEHSEHSSNLNTTCGCGFESLRSAKLSNYKKTQYPAVAETSWLTRPHSVLYHFPSFRT